MKQLQNPNRVYVKAAPSYNQEMVDAAVEYILHNCSLDDLVKRNSRVVIKPNLLMKSHPDNAVTTHPAVVRAVVKSLKARKVKHIVIAESPSGLFSAARLNGIYHGCGMTALTDDGATLNQDLSTTVLQTRSQANPTFEVLQTVTDADLIIGIGKLKTHALTGISGTVKNYFGVIPGLTKPEYHFRYPDKDDFGNMLVDLYEALAPHISLLDAIVGMEGNGPSGGDPREFGFLLGGNNGHCVDRVACYLIGVPPASALTVDTAIKRGLVSEALEDITIKGDFSLFAHPLCDVAMPDSLDSNLTNHLPPLLRRSASGVMHRLVPMPVVRRRDCTGCGRCAETCAPRAVTVGPNKKAYINKKQCIRCFCCHEVCPSRAIDIKKNYLLRVIK